MSAFLQLSRPVLLSLVAALETGRLNTPFSAISLSSILIASFAIDRGDKAQELFGELAQRMDADSQLQVQMFLNVQRPYKSEVAVSILLKEFADIFRQEIWPGQRLPKVFYDISPLVAIELCETACLSALFFKKRCQMGSIAVGNWMKYT